MNINATPRYAQKKQTIIAAASDILNAKGVRGMILADVAAAVGFNTTSVTYYFRRKEDLAVACILAAVERYDAVIAEAAKEASPAARVRRLLELHLQRTFAIIGGDEPPIAGFQEMRALGDAHQATVLAAFNPMFRRLRDLLVTPGQAVERRPLNARANLLLEQLLWSAWWARGYDPEDAPRLCERVFDILMHGLAPQGAAWNPHPLPGLAAAAEAGPEASMETFLRAATRLINQQGYRGASVEKISASLNVTKGSFYHHNEAKDDLVTACFARTYDAMRRAQAEALATATSQYDALASSAAALVAYQLSDAGPLLRSSALTVVPQSIRQQVLATSDRVTARFAAMIADGVAEGSIRPVDPQIAAHMIHAAINAVADLPQLAPGVGPDDAVDLFARTLLTGRMIDS